MALRETGGRWEDPDGTGAIGADLERRRLELRARRLEQVLVVLHRRMRLGPAEPARAGLGRAIREFAAELAEIQARLRRDRAA